MKIEKNTGFMLMEIMVAVAILSVGLVVIIQSLSGGIRHSEASANLALASLLGQDCLWQVQRNGCSYGVTAGNFGEDFPNFRYETEAGPLQANLDAVKLKVIWAEQGREKNIEFETLLVKH